jgi:comEA protein
VRSDNDRRWIDLKAEAKGGKLMPNKKSTVFIAAAVILIIILIALGMMIHRVQQQAASPAEWKTVNEEMRRALVDKAEIVPTPKQAQRKYAPETPSSNEVQIVSSKININEATVEQLDQLPGIGPSKAKAIVAYREKEGSFAVIEDIMKVKGIGPKIFAKIKDQLSVSAQSN